MNATDLFAAVAGAAGAGIFLGVLIGFRFGVSAAVRAIQRAPRAKQNELLLRGTKRFPILRAMR